MFSEKSMWGRLKGNEDSPYEKQSNDPGCEGIDKEQFKITSEGLYAVRIQALM